MNPDDTVDSVTAPSACWSCQTILTAAVGARMPRPGDPTMCVYCGVWSIFDESLTLRRPTSQEQEQLLRDPVVQKILALYQAAARASRRAQSLSWQAPWWRRT